MTDTDAPTITRIYDAKRRTPPIWPYIRETLAHMQFAYLKAKLDLRAAHKDTWFGRMWNVLNPLLLGVVYWLLVVVIFGSSDSIFDRDSVRTLTQILGGLFLFRLPSSALALGARSIVGGGTFVLNTRLPRMLLPVGSVMSAFLGFVPSLGVYAVFHVVAGYPIGIHLLWIIPIIAIATAISLGLAMLLATLNVYFRDITSFLPYFTRIWLYLTPIIYLYEAIPQRLAWAMGANPIGTLFASWQQVLFEERSPDGVYMALSVGWALVVIVVGGLMFMRREREFAVRI